MAYFFLFVVAVYDLFKTVIEVFHIITNLHRCLCFFFCIIFHHRPWLKSRKCKVKNQQSASICATDSKIYQRALFLVCKPTSICPVNARQSSLNHPISFSADNRNPMSNYGIKLFSLLPSFSVGVFLIIVKWESGQQKRQQKMKWKAKTNFLPFHPIAPLHSPCYQRSQRRQKKVRKSSK